MSDQLLQNQLCLVTGASRGIGAAIAEKLSGLGATVVGTATSQGGANSISKALGKDGNGLVLNVNDETSVSDLTAAVNEQYGRPISVLVNNAGITRDNLLMRMKEEEWDEIMDTNLKSVYRMSKACLRGMTKARFGRIISISSVVGASGNAGQANYAAAKAGLVGFSRSLAQEIATRNITVNVVSPGFIRTDMTDALPEAQKAVLMTKIPMARLGEASDVAGAVAYLASPWAEYVTGTVVHVNGGMYMG